MTVDRILIEGNVRNVIKVSLPGHDVNAAPLSQLAFDSRFSTLEVILRGVIVMPRTFNANSAAVFFQTQPRPPFCFCCFAPNPVDIDDSVSDGSAPRRSILGEWPGSHSWQDVTISTSFARFSASNSTGQVVSFAILKQYNG